MGVELLEIGVRVRKGVIFSVKECYRSVFYHPFLVGLLCFLLFLNRSSPFMFQLLVSSSPILVSTAVLLGTLLSLGQPNIPEIEIEEKMTVVEFVSIRTRVLGDAAVGENGSHYVERSSGNRELLCGKLGEVRREKNSDDTAPLLEESEVSNGESRERKRERADLSYNVKTEWIQERLDHLPSDINVNGELFEPDDEKSEADSLDSEKVNVDSLDSPPRSPWARIEEREDEDAESENEHEKDEEASDSGSDRAESSSPDASMADIMPILDEQQELSSGKLGEVRRDENSDDTAPLLEESEVSNGESRERKRELADLRYKTEWIEERLDHLSSDTNVNGELIEPDDEKSEADSFDSEKVNVDSLDSLPRSPWSRVEEQEDEEAESENEHDEDEDEEDEDSGSDRAESSSPDASMPDIISMLDELHPLLDEEAHQTVHLAHSSSDAASEKFAQSSAGSHQSDNEPENHEDLEAADDENEDEEDAAGHKDEETKSAITWTEEDQKNLMDLGSSEIERNLHLENLILKRTLLAERNLIDCESSDLPFNIAPISTINQSTYPIYSQSNWGLGGVRCTQPYPCNSL